MSVFSQEISRKLAITSLYYPENDSRELTEQIHRTIHSLVKRAVSFNVMLLSKEANPEDTNAFAEELNTYYLLIVPRLNKLTHGRDESGYWFTDVEIAISVFKDGSSLKQFVLRPAGYSLDENEAVNLTLSALQSQLEFNLRLLDDFFVHSLIVERSGKKLLLTIQDDMKLGNEYEVLRVSESGEKRIALIRIREVNDTIAIANILYESEPILNIDQVQKLPRIGVDIVPLVSVLFDLYTSSLDSISFSVRMAIAKGFYTFRPIFELGVLFFLDEMTESETQLSLRAGMEYNIFLGRLSLVPQATFGAMGGVVADDSFSMTNLHASLALGLNYLLPVRYDSIDIYAEFAYQAQFGLGNSEHVNGIQASFGIRIR